MKVFALSLLLLCCACATPYQPEGFMGGYSEMQTERHSWVVLFRANGYTAPNRAQDFALIRACELVLEAGCTHYRLADVKSIERRTGSIVHTGNGWANANDIRKPKVQ